MRKDPNSERRQVCGTKMRSKVRASRFLGRSRTRLGELIKDPKLEAKGEAERTAGKVQEKSGKARRKTGEAVQKVGKAIAGKL